MDYQSEEDAPRVLVVDDEKVIREILADFLSMEGFFVRTAEDGGAALVELSRHSYDLVLSDLKMPHMGGIELLGAEWSEPVLLKLAFAYEQLAKTRRPPPSTPPIGR